MTSEPLNPDQWAKLVDAWIARYELIEKQGDQSPDGEALFWAYEEFDALCRRQPEVAWPLILEVLVRTENEFVLENLAAGPLETLLACHGSQMIARVEARAKEDRRFKWLLAGVWQNLIPDAVWDRVQRSLDDAPPTDSSS